jgi:hypothetical protein
MREEWKWPWERQDAPRSEASELEESLERTRALIAQAYAGFNFADDGELVESYIYEIQALQVRYSYLLRRRKALDAPIPAAALEEAPVRPALPVAG